MNIRKATYLGYIFRKGIDTSTTSLDNCDSSQLSHVSRYAPTRFGLVRINALKGPTQAS